MLWWFWLFAAFMLGFSFGVFAMAALAAHRD
jgi:hypothetical protein